MIDSVEVSAKKHMEELLKDKCLDEIRWDAPSPLWLIVVDCNVFFLNDRQTCTSPFLKTGAISPCTSPADVTLDATLFHSPPRPRWLCNLLSYCSGNCSDSAGNGQLPLKMSKHVNKMISLTKSCTSTQLYLTGSGSGSGTLRHRRLSHIVMFL